MVELFWMVPETDVNPVVLFCTASSEIFRMTISGLKLLEIETNFPLSCENDDEAIEVRSNGKTIIPNVPEASQIPEEQSQGDNVDDSKNPEDSANEGIDAVDNGDTNDSDNEAGESNTDDSNSNSNNAGGNDEAGSSDSSGNSGENDGIIGGTPN